MDSKDSRHVQPMQVLDNNIIKLNNFITIIYYYYYCYY